jgi:uncharacterized membrane protein
VTFAAPLPLWVFALVALAALLVAWIAYRDVPIAPVRRRALSALRFTTLVWIVLCLMRPMGRPTSGPRDAVVPILVDTSRSMGLADAGGERRIDRARAAIERDLLPALSSRFHPDVLRFGDRLAPSQVSDLSATDRRTSLGAALDAVRDRYRGRPIAGIVLVSDGGDNGTADAVAAASAGPPVFAVGVGSRAPMRDREIVSVTAAESVLADATVDVAVSAVARGYGTGPFELRLLQNGRQIDLRRVKPAGEGVPVSEVFHVSPSRDAATVYSVEIPPAADEIVGENNTRSVLVPAAGRPRRVLFVQGAPGFEHAFLRRAWSSDRGLEVDSVVRKGRDDSGTWTFYVQAPSSRAQALVGGYPSTRDALFAYDVVVLANVEPDLLTAGQMALTRAFVNERGGGVLLLGAREFQRAGLRDTPLEDVLPLELADKTGGVLQASLAPGRNRVALTPAGEDHPVMQLAATPDESDKRWAAIPALASISSLGGPKPGASVLAVTGGSAGSPRALVAVQRFGEGRSMIFTGEAAWRWRMQLPSQDQSYERFWRQAVRWLAQAAPDPVTLTLPPAPAPDERVPVSIAARDRSYAPRADATVEVRVTAPSGRVDTVRAEAARGAPGGFLASLRAPEAGVYRVAVEARQGGTMLGSSSAVMLVGGVDPEMTDPRLNDDTLQRVARASGGAVIGADRSIDTASLLDRLQASAPAAAMAVRHDLWHTGWSFAVLVALLAAEWLFRRASGLR